MQIRNLVSSWRQSREHAAKNNHQLSDLSPAEIVFMIFCIYGLFLASPFVNRGKEDTA